MNSPAQLLQRLDAIAQSLKASGRARALLGLGSVGTELDRLDEYSDLDFFVIAGEGWKRQFIDDLSWLSSISPIAYHFNNTKDGHKVLFDDGIYCEFAVFEEDEMKSQTFSAGRIVWKEDDFDDSVCVPQKLPAPFAPADLRWGVGEALTCIYVGLCRYARGEKFSAMRFIQSYAADMIAALAPRLEQEHPDFKDQFQNERRFERRFPSIAAALPAVLQGYERSPESALALLELIERYVPVNSAIKGEIAALAGQLIERRT